MQPHVKGAAALIDGGIAGLSDENMGKALQSTSAVADEASLRLAVYLLQRRGSAHSRVLVDLLRAIDIVADAAQQLPFMAVSEACGVVSPLLFHASEETRTYVCSTLQLLFRRAVLPQDPSEDGASMSCISRDTFVALLCQLTSSSSLLRTAALRAIESLPRWDLETFVRAVRIPPFKKAPDDGQSCRPSVADLEDERWHGALYYALDDEAPAARAAVLRIFRLAARRPELAYGKLLEGVFQRLACVSSMCLIDDDIEPRQTAAEALLAMMTFRNIQLEAPPPSGTKAASDAVSVTIVLQALRVDYRLVLQVFQGAKFMDANALEVAVNSLLEVSESEFDQHHEANRQVTDALAHLGQAHANYFKPSETQGCKARDSGVKRCRGLGHRLFTRVLQECKAGSGCSLVKDVGIGALQANAPTLDRLRALLHAAAVKAPSLRTCIEGLEVPLCVPSGGTETAALSLAWWAQQLAACYAQLRTAAFLPSDSPSGDAVFCRPGPRVAGRSARQRLAQIRRACRATARTAPTGGDAFSGHFLAVAAWSELCLSLFGAAKASPRGCEGRPPTLWEVGTHAAPPQHAATPSCAKAGGAAALPCGARLHLATSRLAHGFRWPAVPGGFPLVLLPFRLLALRLLAAHDPSYLEDFEAGCVALGGGAGGARCALERPLGAFLPELSAHYFLALLGPGAPVFAHSAELFGTSNDGRPRSHVQRSLVAPLRFPTALGGQLNVEVRSTVWHGLRLRVSYPDPASDVLWQVAPAAEPSADHLQVFAVPLQFPWPVGRPSVTFSLQLVLLVDSCSRNSNATVNVASAGTGLLENRPLYKQLNILPLGRQVRVPFVAVPQLDDEEVALHVAKKPRSSAEQT